MKTIAESANGRNCKTSVVRSRGTRDPTDLARFGRDARPCAAALAQIREKGYANPYLSDGRPIWAIGLNFDSKTRLLVDAGCERLA